MSYETQVLPQQEKLTRYARKLTTSAADAEDLLQATLTRAFANWQQFRPGTNVQAWLVTIMKNVHYSNCRKRGREPLSLWDDERLLDNAAPASPSAEDGAIERVIMRAVADLGEPFAPVVYLASEGYTYNEISDILGVPVGTVMSRLHRGRLALRKKLAA